MKTLMIMFALVLAQQADQISPKEIIEKAENAIKGKTSIAEIKMDIVNPDYERTLKLKSWWVSGEKALIEITAPAKERGNKTLKIENEIWNYLKRTETLIKIPPSMMLRSWNGSDFTNEDLVRESKLIDDYNINLMFEEKIAGEKCWKMELLPKEDAPVVWGKLYYWVRKSDYLPALIQYYDEDGTLQRTMKFGEYKVMGGRKIPSEWKVISNTKENSHTTMTMLDAEFNTDIPDRIFSFRQLER